MTVTTETIEQIVIRELDKAWTDCLLAEARIEAGGFYYPEDENNAWCYLETAQRTIIARRRELDALRAEQADFEARVDRLAVAATAVGDPLLTALGYLAHGMAVLPAASVKAFTCPTCSTPNATQAALDFHTDAAH